MRSEPRGEAPQPAQPRADATTDPNKMHPRQAVPPGAASLGPNHRAIPAHLLNEHYDDRYFDIVSALDESQHIFFDNSRLAERLSGWPSELPFSIGETGFGAGRNVIALLEYLARLPRVPGTIRYHSVELHPLTPERLAAILEGFRTRASADIDALIRAYEAVDSSISGWHVLTLPHDKGILELHLFFGEALEMLHALETPCDAWFLDGHGPKKNPAMWRPELLSAIGAKTVPGGTCATFTVAGAVRRGLEAAGFTVSKVPGIGGKNHVLQAVREKET